jgi:hypothetical protein
MSAASALGTTSGLPLADGNTSLCQKVLDIAVTAVEAAVKPDSIADDVPRKSVALVGIHGAILSNLTSLFVSTHDQERR